MSSKRTITRVHQIAGRLSIRYKLLTIAMVTATLSLLIVSAAFIWYHTYIARTALQHELTTAAEIIGRNSAAALLFGDRAAAAETLDALRARSDIIGARIESADGRPFAVFAVGAAANSNAALANPDQIMAVIVPVEKDGERIGLVRLWANLDQLSDERQAFELVAVVAVIVAALAGFGFSTLLQPIITRPLNILSNVMKEVSTRQDYTLRAPRTTQDEIGTLIDGFNGMLAEIESQHRELDRYRNTLESQVADRTAELQSRNEELRQTVAELEAAKSRAEAANNAKSDFLANMSHELRTPLNAIIGFSDVMRSEMLGPMNNKAYLDYSTDINFSGNHLLSIINEILDVVRHEAGAMDLDEEVLDVEEVMQEALRVIEPQARRAGVTLIPCDSRRPLPNLRCDRVRVRQMLLNLLSNAVKFTPAGGTVEIAALATDGLEFVVKDTGIGIKAEDIPRVLMPFGQIASVYSRNHQGTGLGLTVTKALVERHGGKLKLDSEVNRGTTVRLMFPRERLVARDATAPTLRAPAAD